MNIQECQPYHAKLDGFTILRMPEGQSVFKVYYLSIIERTQRDKYEWLFSSLTRSEFESTFLSCAVEGIGFVTAFPHVTKIFRFSPHIETVLDFSEFETFGLKARSSDRGDGTREFACYAEALLVANEYRAWAAAASVEEYLSCRSNQNDFLINDNAKLAHYWK